MVRAAPRVLFTQGPDSVLNCSATGFYPSAISFTIGQRSKEVKMEHPAGQLLPDGTFRADSTVSVRAWRAGSDPFYCEVRHEALDQPIRTRQQEHAIPKVSFKLYSEVENLEDTVQCIATGFKPPEIIFTIFSFNTVVKQKELLGESLPDGTYEAKLEYTFMKNHENFRELQCMVTHASMDESIRKHLIVPLTIALQNRAELDKVSDMICVAERFLNPVEYFVWRKGEEVVYSEAAPKGQMPDGTYTAVSWYRFTPSSRDQVSCEVQYQHTKTTRRYVTYTGQSFTELFIVGIVILGPLLLILIIILWHSSVFLSPIVPEKMIYDEPGMLTCSMSGWCLRMVSIKWFLNEEEIQLDAEEDEDKDEDDDNMWESQSDMSGYSMKRGHISRKGCCKAETTISLKFTPTESEHEDRAFKCQATHRMTRKRVARVLVFESEGQ
ncbi:uncharacterized protein LOC114661607 isoform X3 [Erpetoichthys calabaricus]|uniref:uncharacterized protein LOC114661607 isoform X3 n=1 Tax=Erpetoichthys calabaricus TaxID=27687 RepID=UPI00109FC8E6|nr:uncharacterized protein LOC114661607 isoform X3 [Erpetoichthys calabaricus]XP_051790711.1 uncharacterized protein LOC114661607 isoform X3 [Erpetoichthys calabaricus]